MTKRPEPPALELVDPSEIVAPPGLDQWAEFAWSAAVRSLAPARILSHADLLALEGACRSWSRWRQLDDQIAQLGQKAGNVIAGEFGKAANGSMQISAMRQAANEAFKDFMVVAREFGIALPGQRLDFVDTDLFGNPVRPRHGKRGRPPYNPTKRDHDRVQLGLALGWSNDRIAKTLRISLPTLRQYFREELKDRDVMRDRLDMRRLEIAVEQANAGNIAALKLLGALLEQNDLMRARQDFEDEPDEDEAPAPRRLGKKEQALEDARRSLHNDEWGTDLDPTITH